MNQFDGTPCILSKIKLTTTFRNDETIKPKDSEMKAVNTQIVYNFKNLSTSIGCPVIT